MGQFTYVQEANRSPGYCMCCGEVNGPFIDLSLPFVKVASAIGVIDAEAQSYLCVGNAERPGCAVQIGRLTGLTVDTAKMDELHEVAQSLNQEIAELRAALSKKQVTVGDLVSAGVIAGAV